MTEEEKELLEIIYDTRTICEIEDDLYQYGAMRIDLCGLPVEDYTKTIFKNQ